MSCSRGNTCAESRLRALASSSRAARKARSSSPGIPRRAPLRRPPGARARRRCARRRSSRGHSGHRPAQPRPRPGLPGTGSTGKEGGTVDHFGGKGGFRVTAKLGSGSGQVATNEEAATLAPPLVRRNLFLRVKLSSSPALRLSPPLPEGPHLPCEGLVYIARSFPSLFPQCCPVPVPSGETPPYQGPGSGESHPPPVCPEGKAVPLPLFPSILPDFPSSYPSSSLRSYSGPSSKSNLREPHPWVPPFLLSQSSTSPGRPLL